jgi:DNA-directed RNA polymerase sigma subunit (sigma70/sigma32)
MYAGFLTDRQVVLIQHMRFRRFTWNTTEWKDLSNSMFHEVDEMIITLRFHGWTLRAIGSMFDLGAERVRQRESKALACERGRTQRRQNSSDHEWRTTIEMMWGKPFDDRVLRMIGPVVLELFPEEVK